MTEVYRNAFQEILSAVPDDTTWDTDECERHIDNTYDLYMCVQSQGAWMTLDELSSFLEHGIEWSHFNSDIDIDEVDFEHLATLYHAPLTGKGPFD